MSEREEEGMEVTGEQPDLTGVMRTMAEFQAAITCRHGQTIAPACGQGCKRPSWLDSIVRNKNERDPTEPPRTVGDVVREFHEAGKIQDIEVVERFVKGEARRERRRRYTKFAVVAGLSVTTGLLLFQGGRLIYRVWTRRGEKEP